MTELHFAAYCGDRDELVHCLKTRMNPNKKDAYRGYTALHWLSDMAATGGPRVDMLKALAQHKADLDSQTTDGDTALMLACRSGSYCGNELVHALLTLGANPRLRSRRSTCLHEGMWDCDLVRDLIAAGASVDEKDADGKTALDAARLRLASFEDEGGRDMEKIVRQLENAARKK